jgi:NAD(P)-dependent dehydrogenase (short-subunit alcohol dehydrogenase family)
MGYSEAMTTAHTHVPDWAELTGRFRLDGRVALVTGASDGLGARFAAVLASAGARVALTARRAGELAEVAAVVDGGAWIAGDLASDEFRVELIERVHAELGPVDVLVNNAGANDDGPLESEPIGTVREILEVDLVAAIDLCRLVAPAMIARRRGVIVNVSSIFGIVASQAPMVAYNAAKAALINVTRHLAQQWGRAGVRVNALAPGFFPTPLTGHLADPKQRDMIEQATSLGRVPRLDELDAALLFLASDASSYVTGHALVVDGGWTAT